MNLQEAERFAVALAREAGAMIRDGFLLGMRKEWKEDFTPVTATDLDGNRTRLDREVKGCLLANGIVHDELLELPRTHVA